jgi:hypothetical protein
MKQVNGKTEVLTQEEIDALLTPIGYDTVDVTGVGQDTFDPGMFLGYLRGQAGKEEPRIGLYTGNASIVRFSATEHAENVLSDIRALNDKEGCGNLRIPGTSVELINFSRCPSCGKLYGFRELSAYYANPDTDPSFPFRPAQLRGDTRVHCRDCGEWFIPSLVLADALERDEKQFLCRLQTVDAVERYVADTRKRQVLSRKSDNIVQDGAMGYIVNDVDITWLYDRATLIVNLLQYSTPPLMVSFIDRKNVERRDPLFGMRFFIADSKKLQI